MAKLESWQRYRKASPCPVCGGYGAYRPENRCKGFRTADGEGAWCSQATSSHSKYFDALGLDLWFHQLEGVHIDQEQGEGEYRFRRYWITRGSKRQRGRYKYFLYTGLLRHQARVKEAKRPPTVRDFG